MISREVTITNTIGLHARPATFFIQKANAYKCSVWVEKEDRKVNAKSLLGVLSLGIAQGMTIKLIADGSDEIEALEGLQALIDTGFQDYSNGFAVILGRLREGRPFLGEVKLCKRKNFGCGCWKRQTACH